MSLVSGRGRKTRLGDADRLVFGNQQASRILRGWCRGTSRTKWKKRAERCRRASSRARTIRSATTGSGTSIPGIGIHATNAPASIYSYHTHGCVRLDPDNIKDLFHRISKGETGMIVYEPVLFAKTDDGRIFLEVDRDIYEDGGATLDDVRHLADSLKVTDLIDWSGVAAIVNDHDGIAHEVTAKK